MNQHTLNQFNYRQCYEETEPKSTLQLQHHHPVKCITLEIKKFHKLILIKTINFFAINISRSFIWGRESFFHIIYQMYTRMYTCICLHACSINISVNMNMQLCNYCNGRIKAVWGFHTGLCYGGTIIMWWIYFFHLLHYCVHT